MRAEKLFAQSINKDYYGKKKKEKNQVKLSQCLDLRSGGR